MSRRRRLIRPAVLAVVAMFAACGEARPTDRPPASPTTDSGAADDQVVYIATLTGTVSGHAFTRDAKLVTMATADAVATVNGVNPYEACLRSGFPAGSPETGALWFGTNSACFGAPQRIDLVTTQVSGSTYVARPDASLSQLGANAWTALGGIDACIYVPTGGEARYEFHDDGTVTGHLELSGFVGGCGSLGNQSTYSADLTGTRAG